MISAKSFLPIHVLCNIKSIKSNAIEIIYVASFETSKSKIQKGN